MYPCADAVVDPQSLVRIGRGLLDRVQRVYADAGVSLPSRQIWTAGEGVFDCEQLVVGLSSLREGLINSDSPPSQPCDVPVIAVFKVTVVRCIPLPDSRGTPPTPEQIATAADAAAVDAYLLMKSSCKFDMFGADIVPVPHYSVLGGMGVDASVEIPEAEGGMQAVTLTVETVIG